MKRPLISVLATCIAGSVIPETAVNEFRINRELIVHCAGEGDKEAILGIQFNDGYSDRILVWSYRWEKEECVTPEQILLAVAEECGDIDLLTQQTSAKGDRTLAGILYSPGHRGMGNIRFDWQEALDDPDNPFNYFYKGFPGFPDGPGEKTPALYSEAIQAGASTHEIVHPLHAGRCPLPCRDYDHWKYIPTTPYDGTHWNSGWNTGNWVMWTGRGDGSNLTYSGMGYSTLAIHDGDILVRNFNRHPSYPSHTDTDGYTGASIPVRKPDYRHDENIITSAVTLHSENPDTAVFRTLTGLPAGLTPPPGIYIRNGRKIVVRQQL